SIADDGDGSGHARSSGWVPRPSVAMFLALGMIGLGAEIGATAGGSPLATLAATPLIVLHNELAPSAGPQTVASAAGGGNQSGGGSPAGGSSSGGPSAGGSSAAASSNAASSSTTTSSTTTTPANQYGLPSISHVWLIVLSNEGYAQTFGSTDHYLAATLPRQGQLVENYYAVASGELANEIALISGQGPTPQIQSDCGVFANLSPGTTGHMGQVLGHGCVFPRKTETIAGQLAAAKLTWRAYVQGMASGLPGQAQVCRHPPIGKFDTNQIPQLTDPYTTWRNPFVYFHSVIDAKTCASDDVDLTQLSSDLKSASTTPNLSYIAPDACDDGNPQPCSPGASAGIAPMDKFLRTVVPEIESSPAYKAGGLIVITFDQAQQTGPQADSSSCCATPKYPNLPAVPAGQTTTGTTGTSTNAAAALATAATVPGGVTTTTATATTDAGGTTTTAATTTSSDSTSTTDSGSATSTSSSGTSTSGSGTSTSGTSSSGTSTSGTSSTTTTTSSSTSTSAGTTTQPTTTTAGTTTPAGSTTTTSATAPATTTTSSTTPTLGLGGGQTSPTGGGGHVGMLLISPWVKPGSLDVIDYYNTFSLLASLQDIFNLKHLGYGRASGLPAFSASTFNGNGPKGG
ncbi:MAG: alkaline phosphatase family protein, partial [Solirubrobacteraceae bacterium]